MNDPIADLLTRLRNANRALLPTVELPHSRLKENIVALLKREGYLADYSVSGEKIKQLKVKLKYNGRQGVITGLRRISKPGLRHYVGATKMPRVLGGIGVAVLSTSKGVLSSVEARRQNIGGEVLCYVW